MNYISQSKWAVYLEVAILFLIDVMAQHVLLFDMVETALFLGQNSKTPSNKGNEKLKLLSTFNTLLRKLQNKFSQFSFST